MVHWWIPLDSRRKQTTGRSRRVIELEQRNSVALHPIHARLLQVTKNVGTSHACHVCHQKTSAHLGKRFFAPLDYSIPRLQDTTYVALDRKSFNIQRRYNSLQDEETFVRDNPSAQHSRSDVLHTVQLFS